MTAGREYEALYARLDDLCRDCSRLYMPRFLGFLTPEEQAAAVAYVKGRPEVFFLRLGTLEEAGRCLLGLFPKEIYRMPETAEEWDTYREMAELEYVRIDGSGYRVFSHRDVLGSLMALGLKREAVGDIAVMPDGKCVYLAVQRTTAVFLCGELSFVANDKVKVRTVSAKELPTFEQSYEDLSVTLASLRVDALVAELCHLARDKAKKCVEAGNVSCNHAPVTACDKAFAPGDTLSVKGFGKYYIEDVPGLTVKKRYRVIVRKYR